MLVIFLLLLLSITRPVSAQYNRNYTELRENWTSCEEFLNNTEFDPTSVLDIDWKIFYFWNPEFEESYIMRFSRPESTLVDRFRVELEDEIQNVNWNDTELFLESSIDFSALFIRTNVSGKYTVIPSFAFKFHLRDMPALVFAMKLVKPNILGIANCRQRLCYALAPVDHMPDHNQLEKEAMKLEFRNGFNRSHVHINFPTPPTYAVGDDADDDDDDDLEVDQDLSRADFF